MQKISTLWPHLAPFWPRLAPFGQYGPCAHVFASCARVRAQIFTKIFVWVFYYHISLSFKFHTDPSFCCGDIFLTQGTLKYQFIKVIGCWKNNANFCFFDSGYTNFLIKFGFLHNFLAKNLCEKLSKIKNLRWQFKSIFRWLCHGVFNFFCRSSFHGEICKTKWTLFQPFGSTRWNVLKSGQSVLQISPITDSALR